MAYNTKYTFKQNLKTVYNKDNGKYYSQAQLDQWATDITKIGFDKGKNKDKKTGRTKGRYLKGKV